MSSGPLTRLNQSESCRGPPPCFVGESLECAGARNLTQKDCVFRTITQVERLSGVADDSERKGPAAIRIKFDSNHQGRSKSNHFPKKFLAQPSILWLIGSDSARRHQEFQISSLCEQSVLYFLPTTTVPELTLPVFCDVLTSWSPRSRIARLIGFKGSTRVGNCITRFPQCSNVQFFAFLFIPLMVGCHPLSYQPLIVVLVILHSLLFIWSQRTFET